MPAHKTVTAAVKRDLDALRRRSPALAGGALAVSALALARELDDPDVSAAAKASCQRALRETLDRLLELAPSTEERDGLDDLAARRAARRVGGAGA